jgi:hypothetical protein
MASVRAGWEVFTGSVDDVDDTDRPGPAGDGHGGLDQNGNFVPGTIPGPIVVPAEPAPVATTVVEAIEAP